MKNIVALFDGTTFDAEDGSNIYKLWTYTKDQHNDQVTFYDPGVGTQMLPVEAILGSLFGRGIKKNIQQGVDFIEGVYESGDRVYLFGYSRGAYTALGVANKLRVPVHYLGCLDTVGSLGPITRRRIEEVKFSSNICNALHLLARHEYRIKFKPSIWGHKTGGKVLEMAVPGSHADLGGVGEHPELGNVCLQTICSSARAHGLYVSPEYNQLSSSWRGPVTATRTGIWRLWKPYHREFPGYVRNLT